MRVAARPFGALEDGSPIELYTLRARRLEVSVATFGGRVIDIKMYPDGTSGTSVVLGFGTLAPYVADQAYLGALIGRYANRIAHGQFTMGNFTYQLSKNDGDNSLHGGTNGFDRRVWSATTGPDGLRLSYTSAAGEEGYPGDLWVAVTYAVADNELQLVYEARAASDTPINLTNHLYFNLSGSPGSTVLDHLITLHADQFTPVDRTLIPTGELRDVTDTPFDFRTPRAIGAHIDEADPQLRIGQGYDHNWVVRRSDAALTLAAEVHEPSSGRQLQVLTTEPGLQFYTGNLLDRPAGSPHSRRSGFCLETQHFPDSPNHRNFPTTILRAGQVYRSKTIYRFSAG